MLACRLSWCIAVITAFSPLASALAQVAQEAQRAQPPQQTLIAISKETTVVTEPLDDEGYVDLLAAVNQRLSEGVTVGNNAAVPLRQALGLMEMRRNAQYRDQYDRMLGIQPVGDGLWVHLADIARAHGKDARGAYDLLYVVHERPWTADEFPLIAAWLSANAPALEMVSIAAARPRFYAPYIAGEVLPKLMSALLPFVQDSREAARALVARALWHAGEGDTERALDDLKATHRLARLVSQDPTIVGGMVGIAIDAMACYGDVAVVTSGVHSPEQLAAYLARLDRLAPISRLSERVDYFERLMFIDVVVSLARGTADERILERAGVRGTGGTDLLQLFPRIVWDHMNWNAVLREGNGWYDRLVAAMEKETFAEQDAALSAVETQLEAAAENVQNPLCLAAAVLSGRQSLGQIMGQQIGESLVASLLPAVQAATYAEHRSKMLFDLSRVAVALEVYRAEVGEYPGSLEALSVGIMQDVPQDRFSGQPLHYERRGGGHLLYSVGRNGQDDAATSYLSSTIDGEHVPVGQVVTNDDGDDLVIRVPLPE